MQLKNYQQSLLDDYAAFLARARELKNPEAAFRESTRNMLGFELPYTPLENTEAGRAIPYVCLRVPTGGGKTLLAGHSIKAVNDRFLFASQSLVLWLVPSDAIREQTLYVLKTPGEILHQAMRELFGAVNVLDVSEALAVQPATLNTANTIIVATMQSFKRDSPDGLRVNRQNGALMPHFEGVSREMRGEGSLVDVIRLRRPFASPDHSGYKHRRINFTQTLSWGFMTASRSLWNTKALTLQIVTTVARKNRLENSGPNAARVSVVLFGLKIRTGRHFTTRSDKETKNGERHARRFPSRYHRPI